MRRSYGDNKEKSVSVTAKIAESLAVKIEDYWKNNGMSSRSELLETAAEFYITSQKCPKCGAINPEGGTRCSVCGESIGRLKDLITRSDELFKKIQEMIPPIRQKYDICLTTIKALKINDTFLLQRFDLITAKIIGSKEGETPEYFLDTPQWQPLDLEKKESYNLYQGITILTLKLNAEILEELESNKGECIPELQSKYGYTHTEMAGNVFQNLMNIYNGYNDISAELDQISKYLTARGKESEKEEKKGKK